MTHREAIMILEEEFGEGSILETLKTISEMSEEEFDWLSGAVRAAYYTAMHGFTKFFLGE